MCVYAGIGIYCRTQSKHRLYTLSTREGPLQLMTAEHDAKPSGNYQRELGDLVPKRSLSLIMNTPKPPMEHVVPISKLSDMGCLLLGVCGGGGGVFCQSTRLPKNTGRQSSAAS